MLRGQTLLCGDVIGQPALVYGVPLSGRLALFLREHASVVCPGRLPQVQQGVFVALVWATLIPVPVHQLTKEQMLWDAVVLHPGDMA